MKEFIIFFVTGFIFYSLGYHNGSEEQTSLNPSQISANYQNENESSTSKDWVYMQNEDKISGDSEDVYAITSKTTVDFKFPYNGKQSPTLVLVKKNNKPADVIFIIEKGVYACKYNSDLKCSFRVKFGDSKPHTFHAIFSESGKDENLYITNAEKFYNEISKVKSAVMEIVISDQGTFQFDFEWENSSFLSNPS